MVISEIATPPSRRISESGTAPPLSIIIQKNHGQSNPHRNGCRYGQQVRRAEASLTLSGRAEKSYWTTPSTMPCRLDSTR